MVRLRLAALGIAASLAGASSGASAPDAAPAPAPFRWDGLERRNPGLLVFRSRWDPGTLELRDDLVRWADRKNPGKNLVLPVRRLTGHTLVCRGPAGAPGGGVLFGVSHGVEALDEDRGLRLPRGPAPLRRRAPAHLRRAEGRVLGRPRRGDALSYFAPGTGVRISSQSNAAASVRSSVAPGIRFFGDSA